ncbi:hypothetical protein E9O_00450 [Moraxella catarrhalis 12P80B1]|nr:hypothetical protein MCR_0724 [Moraxella catarrhalis BBH18]EGE17749.1 hypothetical protein E9O_00450 [Moraxella catarrhalis 12P80B1]
MVKTTSTLLAWLIFVTCIWLNRGLYHKNSHLLMLMPNKNPIMLVMSNKK